MGFSIYIFSKKKNVIPLLRQHMEQMIIHM